MARVPLAGTSWIPGVTRRTRSVTRDSGVARWRTGRARGGACYSAWRAAPGGARSRASGDEAECGRAGHLTCSYSGIARTPAARRSCRAQVSVALLEVRPIEIRRERLAATAAGAANVDRALCGARPRAGSWRVGRAAVATREQPRVSLTARSRRPPSLPSKAIRIAAGRRASGSTSVPVAAPARAARARPRARDDGARNGCRAEAPDRLVATCRDPTGASTASSRSKGCGAAASPSFPGRSEISRPTARSSSRQCLSSSRSRPISSRISATWPTERTLDTRGARDAPLATPCPSTPPT